MSVYKGVPPKQDDERARANGTTYDAGTVEDDGEVRGPELPDSVVWPEETQEWWADLRTSPLTRAWMYSDWASAMVTAGLHARYWNGLVEGTETGASLKSLANEIRVREANYGATETDRRKLNLKIAPSDKKPNLASVPDKLAPVENIADRFKQRLGNADGRGA